MLLNVCLGRDFHAHRVVAFVQTQHARRHTSACDRQRVSMRTHTEPHTVARKIETAVTIGTDRPRPNVAIRRRWPTDDVAVEPGNLSGVQHPINDQLSRASQGRRPYVRAPTPGLSRAACGVPTDRAAAAFQELPLRCAI
uniref:Uncharacterized protein n=1 Tax=Mycolicibacterium gilvum (strain PYR-GCK) TaxID=350054 RepID=A4T232_MYCGI|nr:hypothetical protein Mflv_2794 [Mycolicibacterium gilvum PYR-GCK]